MPVDALFNYGLVCVKVGDKWGFANKQGEIVIEPQFSRPGKFHQGVYPASKDGKYGYINTKGEWVIEPQFLMATEFREGYALVIDNPEALDDPKQRIYKLIDGCGNVVFNVPEGSNCWPVCDGMIPTWTQDGRLVVYSTSGDVLFDIEADLFDGDESTYWVFFEGLMAVCKDEKWGYINTKGEWVIEPRYERADYFVGGIAQVEVDGKAGYVDKNGNFVIEPQYEYGYDDPSEGLIGVTSDTWSGYIDLSGNQVIDLSAYEWVLMQEFTNGVATISTNNGYGLIDKNGNYIVSPSYQRISRFNCGLASFETNDRRYGYLDSTGKELIPAEYRWTTRYYDDGYGVVMNDAGKFTILDQNGQPLFDEKFDGIGNYYVYIHEDGKFMNCITGR